MQNDLKMSIWLLLTGFSDGFFNLSDLKQHICKESNCDKFLNDEIKQNRVIYLKNTPFKKFTACEYFCIQEEKNLQEKNT